MIAVEEIRPGFVVTLPRNGDRVVSEVREFEDGSFVIVYFQHGDVAYENRARAHGPRHISGLCLRGIRPLRRGERFPARPGPALEAERLRAQLEREETRRTEQILDRAYA